jgi:hypothetical protein
MIGRITLDAKPAGQRSAGNPHAPLDEAGTGNGGDDLLERDTHPKGEKQPGLAGSKRPPRQSSTLLRAGGLGITALAGLGLWAARRLSAELLPVIS